MSSPVRYSTSPAPWVPGALLHKNDCLPALRAMPDASVSCVITDPPYGLSDVKAAEVVRAITAWAQGDRERVPDGKGFMGHEWDRFVPPPAVWDECMRVLRPGGYMAVFAGSRTADLMGLSIRLAGFEMRDTITWMYGSGFPKSLDVGKAINKTAGVVLADPTTDDTKKWDGWGTALKPAGEPIIVARKPFPGTVANNVLAHDTGAININKCRVDSTPRTTHARGNIQSAYAHPMSWGTHTGYEAKGADKRWPSNVILSHSEWCDETEGCAEGCPIAELDAQSGQSSSLPSRRRLAGSTARNGQTLNHFAIKEDVVTGFTDSGGASRFFNTFRYQAKAPKYERPVVNGVAHPTVKPLALMEWLVTLLTPPYGTVLDPFTGSGTTGHAALKLGFNSIIIERDVKYWPLIEKRFTDYLAQRKAG